MYIQFELCVFMNKIHAEQRWMDEMQIVMAIKQFTAVANVNACPAESEAEWASRWKTWI